MIRKYPYSPNFSQIGPAVTELWRFCSKFDPNLALAWRPLDQSQKIFFGAIYHIAWGLCQNFSLLGPKLWQEFGNIGLFWPLFYIYTSRNTRAKPRASIRVGGKLARKLKLLSYGIPLLVVLNTLAYDHSLLMKANPIVWCSLYAPLAFPKCSTGIPLS